MNRRNFFKSALGLAAFAATGISCKPSTAKSKPVTGTGTLEMIVDGERVYRTNERQKLLLNHDPADSIGHLEGGYLVPNEFGAELIKRLKNVHK